MLILCYPQHVLQIVILIDQWKQHIAFKNKRERRSASKHSLTLYFNYSLSKVIFYDFEVCFFFVFLKAAEWIPECPSDDCNDVQFPLSVFLPSHLECYCIQSMLASSCWSIRQEIQQHSLQPHVLKTQRNTARKMTFNHKLYYY